MRPGFTADMEGTYIAQLIVDDGSGPSVPKTVLITTGNTVPIADAGPDQSITFIVGEGDEEVMLDEVVVVDAGDDQSAKPRRGAWIGA
ncbi:MAG: hypothetical protein IIC08_04050 [Proteobacteria bacterium]|nr:hypothetical protein [Pseudomonadota bacterium]